MPELPLIACVDDDDSVCEALEEFLRAAGFAARAFSSAEEFLAFDRIADTACLITDVQLGGLSGLQLQDRLVKAGFDFPVIVITAFVNDATRAQALAGGARYFLGKPVRMDELLACLRSTLGQSP